MQHRCNPAMNRRENPKKLEHETNHHIMPQSRADCIVKEAQVMLFESFHDSFHRIFGNGTPTEQIYKLLTINGPVFTDNFKNEIVAMLNDDQFTYTKGLWRPKH